MLRELLQDVEDAADILLLAGDLTNLGLVDEMEVLLEDLQDLSIPIMAVLGNHDYENDHAELLMAMLRSQGIHVLECTVCVMDGVGFVGTKGFCGGFGRYSVQTFGEQALKSFVQEGMDEAERLNEALGAIGSKKKVVVTHYSPTRDTLKGESEEVYAFLGTSRLAEVLDKNNVDVVFHGHAHHGSPRGRTYGGIVVHNVSRFVQMRFGPRAYYVLEL
jgi:Icc-related predicted phosphoesterase